MKPATPTTSSTRTAIARMFDGIRAARPLPAFFAASIPGSSGCMASTREIQTRATRSLDYEHTAARKQDAADEILGIRHRAGRNVLGGPFNHLQVFDLDLCGERQIGGGDDDA